MTTRLWLTRKRRPAAVAAGLVAAGGFGFVRRLGPAFRTTLCVCA